MPSAVEFRTSSGGDPAQFVLEVTQDLQPNEGDLRYAVELQKSRILARTAAGVDVDSHPFLDYAPGYAVYRAKRGRNPSPVTLSFTGKMHQAIQVFVDGLQAKLGIYNDEAVRASAHNRGTQHLPRRHWFGATLTDLADMANEIAGRIDRRVRGKA